VLMALLAKQAESLHRYHPRAQMWMSPQGFTQAWMDQFFAILRDEQPAWLAGVVYGPQVRGSIAELRAAVPKRYAIRHYPDITHSRQSEYPVPDWDYQYAITEGREGINPRPVDMARIFRTTQPNTKGFISYSEGCNDDVNKIVWSSLGWDSKADIDTILNEYARYFIGEKFSHQFAIGLRNLERNWRGVTAPGVALTLASFQQLEMAATERDLLNWRFQQALYRAYYDAYVHERVIDDAHANKALRARVFELGEALFKSIKMQLSVPLYQAIAVDRGANLDTIDVPLISEVKEDEIAGAIHDDLGVQGQQPHLVRGPSTYNGVSMNRSWPTAWWTHAGSLYDEPLRMRYSGLDAKAHYKLRVVYAGDSPRVRMKLLAGTIEVHPFIDKPNPMKVLEFDIPEGSITPGGELLLTWSAPAGQGGNGRGNEVAETWLIKVVSSQGIQK